MEKQLRVDLEPENRSVQLSRKNLRLHRLASILFVIFFD